MAKNMARVEDGVVVNVEWMPSDYVEDEYLKEVEDKPVGIGDTYVDGKFYRDGVEVLSLTEERLINVETQLTDTQLALCDSYEAQMVTEDQLTETQIALCDAYEAQIAAEEALAKTEQELTDTQLALCDVYELIEGLTGGVE